MTKGVKQPTIGPENPFFDEAVDWPASVHVFVNTVLTDSAPAVSQLGTISEWRD